MPDELYYGLPLDATPGTVGVRVWESESEEQARKIQEDVVTYLEISGVRAESIAAAGRGGAATGALVALFVTVILPKLGEELVLGGLAYGGRRIWKENRRRKLEAQKEHLPSVIVRLEDKRGERADVLRLVEILDGLEDDLAARHPNRRYFFQVESSSQVIPQVEVVVAASEMTESVRLSIGKLLRKYEGADLIRLQAKRNRVGAETVEVMVYPPTPRFDNPQWNGMQPYI